MHVGLDFRIRDSQLMLMTAGGGGARWWLVVVIGPCSSGAIILEKKIFFNTTASQDICFSCLFVLLLAQTLVLSLATDVIVS